MKGFLTFLIKEELKVLELYEKVTSNQPNTVNMIHTACLRTTHYLELENVSQGLIRSGLWGCVEVFGLTRVYRAAPYISLLLFYTLQRIF